MNSPQSEHAGVCHRFSLYCLPENGSVRIGTRPNNDVCLATESSDPRTLAVLELSASGAPVLRCLSDGHDVWVEGQPVSIVLMASGQVASITTGPTEKRVALKILVLPGLLGLWSDDIPYSCGLPPYEPSHGDAMMPRDGVIAAGWRAGEYFTRSPRLMDMPDTEVIRIDGPPSGNAPWDIESMTSRPLRYLISRLPFFQGIRARDREQAAYARRDRYFVYLDRKRDVLEARKRQLNRCLETQYPLPATIPALLMGKAGHHRLWERSPADNDFGTIRVGLGKMPSGFDIRLPEETPLSETDVLAREARRLKEAYATLASLPVTLSFRESQQVGIVGPQAMRVRMVRSFLLQLCAFHAPDELKIACIAPPSVMTHFPALRMVPHAMDATRTLRLFAETPEEAYPLMRYLLELPSGATGQSGSTGPISAPGFGASFMSSSDSSEVSFMSSSDSSGSTFISSSGSSSISSGTSAVSSGTGIPLHVLFVLDHELATDIPLLRRLQEMDRLPSVRVVFSHDRMSQLPQACSTQLQLGEDTNVLHVRDRRQNRSHPFVPDLLEKGECPALAAHLGRVRYHGMEPEQPLPEKVSFLSVLGKCDNQEGRGADLLDIRQRWRESRPDHSLAVPVGLRLDQQRFLLDLHENGQGPHGLVAGMTGFGKSAFLQTFLLSLAVSHSPETVSFLLIDFKGGGMANALAGLPHVAGMVTNLSESTLNRALRALRAEVRQRQQLLADAGMSHIDAYLQAWMLDRKQKPIQDQAEDQVQDRAQGRVQDRTQGRLSHRMPHLFVVCDEFAQLRSGYPEFLRDLIDVAQIGRSLGLHLVLATQKPAGIVDDQIWGNARFRACFKVMDRQDSMGMLHRPDAMLLRQPGRCYYQVGNDEGFGEIQTAYAGDPYVPGDFCTMPETRHVSLVDATGRVKKSLSLDTLGRMDWPVGTAHAGSPDIEDGRNRAPGSAGNGWTGKASLTQLEAVSAAIRSIAEQDGLRTHPLWLPPLPERLSLDEILALSYSVQENPMQENPMRKNPKWKNPVKAIPSQKPSALESPAHEPSTQAGAFRALIGLSDDPDHRAQHPVWVDFARQGHLVVFGMPGSGRTTLLQTLLFSLAMRHMDKEVRFNLLDFESRTLGCFAGTPHCLGVRGPEEEAAVAGVLDRLLVEAGRRRLLFSGRDVGDWEGYAQAAGIRLPMHLLVLDSFPVFRERMPHLLDRLLRLVREGAACGIFAVITGTTRTSLPYQLLDHVRTCLTLQQPERYHYREIMGDTDGLVPDAVPGRGLLDDGGIRVFQTALAVAEPMESLRIRRIRELLEQRADILAPEDA